MKRDLTTKCPMCKGYGFIPVFETETIDGEIKPLPVKILECSECEKLTNNYLPPAKMDKNLQILLNENEGLFGKIFENEDGDLYIFCGILIGQDDYYYMLKSLVCDKVRLLSCVGNIENFGLKLKV